MNKLKQLLNNNKAFLIPCAIFWIVVAFPLSMYNKVDMHLWFNQFYSLHQDILWVCVTEIGGNVWIFLTILIVGTLLSYRFSLYMLMMGLIMVILVYLLKNYFDTMRPERLFNSLGIFDLLHTVPDYNLYANHSFPSGHTTTAFGVFAMIAIFVRKNWMKFSVFVIALAVGYSRIYLSQHFLEDVYGGSMIGVVVAFGTYFWLSNSRWIGKIKFLKGSLIKL